MNSLRHIIVGVISAILSAVVERAARRYEAPSENAPQADDEQAPAQDDEILDPMPPPGRRRR